MAEDGRNREKIVSIDLLRARQTRRLHPGPLESSHATSLPEPPPSPRSGPENFASLEANERAELLREMRAELAELPDIRADKVIEAKLRISSGHYDREEWKQDLAKLLLRAMRRSPAPCPMGTTTASPPEPGT